MKKLNPKIHCTDGVSLSVQANQYAYCSPRNDECGAWENYASVEVGFITAADGQPLPPPDDWREYADGDFPADVYGYVPTGVVESFIAAHGVNLREAAHYQSKIVVEAICASAFAAEAHRKADNAVETEQKKLYEIMAARWLGSSGERAMTTAELLALPDVTPRYSSTEIEVDGKTVRVPVREGHTGAFYQTYEDGIFIDADGTQWMTGWLNGQRVRQRK